MPDSTTVKEAIFNIEQYNPGQTGEVLFLIVVLAFILERALASARQVPIDRVIDELGEDIKVEEVSEATAGQVILDIRHPDAAEDEPLELSGIEVQTLPFYALNNRFKELDENRQYLLYCDKGVMSRLHAHHLLSEGHVNVRVYRPA